MDRARNIYRDTDNFQLTSPNKKLVRLSFGSTDVWMTLDAALDFQYRLAALLAFLELHEYPEEKELEPGSRLSESRHNLTCLARMRKFDA